MPGAASPHVCEGSPGWDGEDLAQEKGARRGCFNRVVTPRCGLFLLLLPPACNLGAVRSSMCKSSWESEVDGLTEPRRRQAWNIAGGWGNWGSPSSSTGQLCFTSCFGELLSHCLTNLHFHRKSQKGYPALSRSLPDLTSFLLPRGWCTHKTKDLERARWFPLWEETQPAFCLWGCCKGRVTPGGRSAVHTVTALGILCGGLGGRSGELFPQSRSTGSCRLSKLGLSPCPVHVCSALSLFILSSPPPSTARRMHRHREPLLEVTKEHQSMLFSNSTDSM